MDDESLTEEDGWITQLRLLLTQELSSELGQRVSIFQDERAQRNGDLDDVIVEALRSSALFVAVVTPRFCVSDWCSRELESFITNANAVKPPDANARLFKVIARQVELQAQPPSLRGAVGYEFIEIDPRQDLVFTLPLKYLDDPGKKQTREFRRLVRDLKHGLEECNRLQAAKNPEREISAAAHAAAHADGGLPQFRRESQPPHTLPSQYAEPHRDAQQTKPPEASVPATRDRPFSKAVMVRWKSFPRAARYGMVLAVITGVLLGAFTKMSPAQREASLIALHYWPQKDTEDWDDPFDLREDGVPDDSLWTYDRKSWKIENVPFFGPDGLPLPASEGLGSLVTKGPRWGIRALKQSFLRKHAYYDYTVEFQVRFLKDAKSVSWVLRADADRGRGYVFSLVKRNNALYLNGFAQEDGARDCGVRGTSDGCVPLKYGGRLVTNEYIDPTDTFTITATTEGFNFRHCIDFIYTKLDAPDGTPRSLVKEDCQKVQPMSDEGARFRFGTIGFAGPPDGSEAAVEFVKVTFPK